MIYRGFGLAVGWVRVRAFFHSASETDNTVLSTTKFVYHNYRRSPKMTSDEVCSEESTYKFAFLPSVPENTTTPQPIFDVNWLAAWPSPPSPALYIC